MVSPYINGYLVVHRLAPGRKVQPQDHKIALEMHIEMQVIAYQVQTCART